MTNITSTESVLREFNIQQDVFVKSITDPFSFFEPICPALITGICNINESIKNNLRRKIIINLKQRTTDETDSSAIHTLFEHNISFIMMEFMEGYQLLTDLERDENFRKYKLFSLYELSKLHSYGYRHGDFHNSNVLIHKKYPYFTNKKEEDLEGRAIIIDFGSSESVSIANRDRVRNIIQYENYGPLGVAVENDFRRLDGYRFEIAKDFVHIIIEKGWDIHNLPQYDLLGYNRSVLRGGLKPITIKRSSSLKLKDKKMEKLPRELKSWWSSPEEEKLAIDELRAALDRQRNDKDYHKNIHEHAMMLVNELENNDTFQKMVTGIYKRPVFIREHSETQDELAKLLEEYDEKEKEKEKVQVGSNDSKKTKQKRTYNKRNRSNKNKTSKSK